MRATLSAALVLGLTAITISGPAAATIAAAAPSTTTQSAFSGREVFNIIRLRVTSQHPKVIAKGAFRAIGYLDGGRVTTAVFRHGTIEFRHRVASTEVSGPNLQTCWFREWQRGTVWVVGATGRYAGIRYRGDFWTTISAQLAHGSQSGCGTKIVHFRELTHESGQVS